MSLSQLLYAYLITRSTQGRVQNCPVFSHIQVFPSKHLTNLGLQVGRASQVPEQLQYTLQALKILLTFNMLNTTDRHYLQLCCSSLAIHLDSLGCDPLAGEVTKDAVVFKE